MSTQNAHTRTRMAAYNSQADTQTEFDSKKQGTLRHNSNGAAKGSLSELPHVNTIQHHSAALHKSSSSIMANL